MTVVNTSRFNNIGDVMREYRAFPRGIRAIEPSHIDDGYWSNSPATITVHTEETSVNTGLLDSRGNPIYSVNRIGPIGFNR
jgi:hypothetical protein